MTDSALSRLWRVVCHVAALFWCCVSWARRAVRAVVHAVCMAGSLDDHSGMSTGAVWVTAPLMILAVFPETV